MKRILAMAICVALLATVAITGSVAFLTSTDKTVNTMTMGNVEIKQYEKDRDGADFENNQRLLPSSSFSKDSSADTNSDTGLWTANNGEIDKIVTVKNTGDTPAYVRTIFAFEDTGSVDTDGLIVKNWNGSAQKVENGSFYYNGEIYNLYVYTYANPLAKGETTDPSLRQFAMAAEAKNDVAKAIEESADGHYTILVATQAVQAENMGTMSASEALNAAFEEITSTNNPWVNDEVGNTEAGNVVRISSKNALKSLGGQRILTNTTYVLSKDIDMDGESMDTILIDAIVKFDGNHHTISNVKLNSNVGYGFSTAAMFDVVLSDSTRPTALTVENVNFEKVTVTGSKIDDPGSNPYEPIGAAVVVGYVDKASSVTLKNVNVSKSNITNEYGEAAALVGYSYSSVAFNNCKVTDCTIVGEEKTYDDRDMDGVYNTAIAVDTDGKYRKNSAFVGTVNGWGQNPGLTLTITDCVNGTNAPDWHRHFTTTVTGSAKQVIAIGTKEQLIAFANNVNNGTNFYDGQTVMLTADIDLDGMTWTPIGRVEVDQTQNKYFLGTFDGNGHTIKNFKVENTDTSTDYTTAGLFGWTDAAGATIKNLTIDHADVKGSHYTGAIVGYLTGTIENCTVKNSSIESEHKNSANCGDKAGAVIGFMNKNATATNCHAESCTVKAGRDAGQVIGCCDGSGNTVTNCTATNVTVSAGSSYDCTNAGSNIQNDIIGRPNGVTNTTT